MSILTKTQLKSKLDLLISANGNNDITGDQLNGIITDVIDSVYTLIDDGQDIGFIEFSATKDYLASEITWQDGNIYISREDQTAGAFVSSKWVKITSFTDLSGFDVSFTDWSAGTYNDGDLVRYNKQYFKCINDGSTSNPDTGAPDWEIVYAHNGDRTLDWQSGYYLENQVITRGLSYYKLLVSTGLSSYNSTDIDAEITAGDWMVFNNSLLPSSAEDNTLRYNGSGVPVPTDALTSDGTNVTVKRALLTAGKQADYRTNAIYGSEFRVQSGWNALSGSFSWELSSNKITGIGTKCIDEIQAFDYVRINGEIRLVDSVNSQDGDFCIETNIPFGADFTSKSGEVLVLEVFSDKNSISGIEMNPDFITGGSLKGMKIKGSSSSVLIQDDVYEVICYDSFYSKLNGIIRIAGETTTFMSGDVLDVDNERGSEHFVVGSDPTKTTRGDTDFWSCIISSPNSSANGKLNAPILGGKGIVQRQNDLAAANALVLQQDKASNPSNYQAYIFPKSGLTADKVVTINKSGNLSVREIVYEASCGSLILSGSLATVPNGTFAALVPGNYKCEFSGSMNLDELSNANYEIQINGVAINGSFRTETAANYQGSGNEDRVLFTKTLIFPVAVNDVIDVKVVATSGSGLVRAGGLFELTYLG